MKRNTLEKLIFWMKNEHSKPLWLSGAPEVGKTYLALEFAKMFYEGYFYMNVKSDALFRREIKNYMAEEPESFSGVLMKYYELPSDWLGKFLFILDDFADDTKLCEDIQKVLMKNNELDRGRALILISVKNPSEAFKSFVETVQLFPMEFDEYLSANGSEWYVEVIRGHFWNKKKVPGIVHKEMLNLFQDYLKTGGMPEAVSDYMTTGRFDNVPVIQRKINQLMNSVIVQNDENLITKSLQLMQTYPEQLLKSNKKFQYNKIRKGITHNMYSDALDALVELNIVNKLERGDILPLEGTEGEYAIHKHANQFRLYSADFGLLNATLNAELPTNLTYDEEFDDEINPYGQLLLENYLLQHMMQEGKDVCFWESASIASIDFVEKNEDGIIPYEVRYLNNNRSKSLSVFKNNIVSPYSIRLHSGNFDENDTIKYIPYYAIFCL